jgi:hypothetical protein
VDVIYALLSSVFTILLLWFWKPWAGAYAGEKGKNLARKEDLDIILAEVRAATATQREIEATISGEMWEHQWRLNQKRDVYARLIEGMGELQLTFATLAWFAKSKDSDHTEGASELSDRTKTLLLECERSRAVARIFLSSEAVKTIDEFECELKRPPKELVPAEVSNAFARATEKLISAARNELGAG